MRTYSELITLPTFEERFNYLKLDGVVGESTFGFERYLNQVFYKSREWRRIRDDIIVRDNGCDLGVEGYEIFVNKRNRIYIHHINPIVAKDILELTDYLLDPEYLICTTYDTHNAIHYGDPSQIPYKKFIERTPNDTCPWRITNV